MHLGTLIGRLESEQDAAAALETLGDLVLYARTADMAARFGESPAQYASVAVARFAAMADDEQWVGLVGALERAENPARTALGRMLVWALALDARELAEEPAQPCGCRGTSAHVHGTI